jgi:hypothetical protein
LKFPVKEAMPFLRGKLVAHAEFHTSALNAILFPIRGTNPLYRRELFMYLIELENRPQVLGGLP